MRSQTTRWTLIALALLAVVAIMGSTTRADGPVTPQNSGPFADVPANHWAAPDIQYLVARGIIQGNPSGDFQGDRAPSRYEVAAMLARAMEYLQNGDTNVANAPTSASTSSSPNASPGSQLQPTDVKTLQDLIFKISDKLQQVSNQVDTMQSSSPQTDPQMTAQIKQLQAQSSTVTQLQNQLQQSQQQIQDLQNQMKDLQAKSQTASQGQSTEANQQILANRIIGITGLIFAVVSVALTTLK